MSSHSASSPPSLSFEEFRKLLEDSVPEDSFIETLFVYLRNVLPSPIQDRFRMISITNEGINDLKKYQLLPFISTIGYELKRTALNDGYYQFNPTIFATNRSIIQLMYDFIYSQVSQQSMDYVLNTDYYDDMTLLILKEENWKLKEASKIQEAKIQRLIAKNKELEEKLVNKLPLSPLLRDRKKTEEVDKLKVQIEKMNVLHDQERLTHQTEMAALRIDNENLRKKYVEKNQLMAKLLKELDLLSSQILAMSEQAESEKKRVDRLENENIVLKGENAELKKEIGDVKKEMVAIKEEIRSIQSMSLFGITSRSFLRNQEKDGKKIETEKR